MNRLTIIILVLLAFGAANAQNSLPTKWNDETRLTVLNSRLGSRFSFSLSTSENAVRMGALGFDNDETTGFYMGLENAAGKSCFRTIDRQPATCYFDNGELSFGFTCSEMKGETDGLIVKTSIVSPFTVSKDLDDTFNVQTQVIPVYYIVTEIQNNSGSTYSGILKTGFKKSAVKQYSELAVRSAPKDRVYFRDNSDPKSKVLYEPLSAGFKTFTSQTGINGLEKEISLKNGETITDTLLVAGFYEGKVVRDLRTNEDLKFYYTKFWDNVDEVAAFAKENKNVIFSKTNEFESILTNADAKPEEKWVAALAFRSDMANSVFLADGKGQPRFYVEEGRFQHLSTIDVAHETEVAAMFAPWRLKLQLEQWTQYLALKKVHVAPNKILEKGAYHEGMTAAEYGPFLYHDVGDFPFVDYTSNYNYGPNMSVEESTDYILLLYWYWKLTGDNQTVKSLLGLTDVLLQSMVNRDTDNSGIVDAGYGWTTYDVSDALKVSPENTYLGVKQLCAYTVSADMFVKLAEKGEKSAIFKGDYKVADGEGVGFQAVKISNEGLRKKQAEKYTAEAEKIFKTLKKAHKKYGFIPISLDESFPGWQQHSLVTAEGLFLPGIAGAQLPMLDKLANLLSGDYKFAFDNNRKSYGIRLVEDEPVTWFSKTMVADVVASYWFGIDNSTANYTYQWNKNNYYAYNDGAMNEHQAWGGNWYPRGVSALMYLFRNEKMKGNDLFMNLYEQ